MKSNWEQMLVKNQSTREIDPWLIIPCSDIGKKNIFPRTFLKREAGRIRDSEGETYGG